MDLSTWIYLALTLVLLAAAVLARRLLLLSPAVGALAALVASLLPTVALYWEAGILAAATGLSCAVSPAAPPSYGAGDHGGQDLRGDRAA